MDTPQDWDDFAQTYTEIQAESQLPIQTDVIKALMDQHLLPTQSVLDLASGSGRYGIELAQHAAQVTMLDWSTNMLALAKAAAQKQQLTNIAYTTANWQEYHQPADLVFISQLPTLKASDLTKIMQLSGHAIAINHQTRQDDHLLTAGAQYLHIPTPPVYQASATLMADYHTWLQEHDIAYQRVTFDYQRSEKLTVADLAPEFGVPLGVQQLADLAQAITGNPDPHHPATDTIDYQFELLTWLV